MAFDAFADGDRVHLTWQTASELNNAGFEVQYRVQGNGMFETIAFVSGAGTTNEPQSYSHAVENLAPGIHEFRLQQIDFDGTFAFSDVVTAWVEIDAPYQASALHPNPFNPSTQFSLSVKVSQQVQIDVYDLTGRHIERLFNGIMTSGTEENFTWQAASVPSGVYYIRVEGERFTASKRAILVK